MEDRRFTKHGFPRGFRFAPTHLELITILTRRVNNWPLHPKVAAIFHDLNILDYHPEELHDMYERDKEDRYIYFFSWRQHQRTAGAAGGGKKRHRGAAASQDEDDNEPRPVRLARGGGWKASGGGIPLHRPKEKGGCVVGKMVTMVFYDHRPDRDAKQEKSHWGMHEFTIPLDERQLSKPAKTRRSHELALYRLYRLKSDEMESDDGAGSQSNQTLANVSAADGHFSAPCPAGQPSFGIFTGRNQPLDAGASTSRMPPPQHHIPNVGHPQYYHHQQHGFGAAPPPSAADQWVRTMAMPPAYGTGMPGPQSLQFETYGGAGQQANHSGATRLPPPAAESPSAQELAPMTATHGGAGQEAGGNSGATRSSQDAAATAETGQHVQFPDRVQTEEESMPPPMEDRIPAGSNDGIGLPVPASDLDLGMDWIMSEDDYLLCDDNLLFTLDELCQTTDESPPTPTPTQKGDNN